MNLTECIYKVSSTFPPILHQFLQDKSLPDLLNHWPLHFWRRLSQGLRLYIYSCVWMYSRAESGSTNGSPLVNSRRFLLNQNATIPNSLSEPDTLSLWNSCSIFKHSWIVTTQSNQEHLGASVRTKVHDYTEEMHRGHGLSLENISQYSGPVQQK